MLELPEDIEGILVLNINSYMGGVNLWAQGAWQPGRHTAARQSICDGQIEVQPQTLASSEKGKAGGLPTRQYTRLTGR